MRRIVIRRASEVRFFEEGVVLQKPSPEPTVKPKQRKTIADVDCITVDDWLETIEACYNNESLLTEWEANFLESIQLRLEGNLALTPKQEATLERILNALYDRANGTRWGGRR